MRAVARGALLTTLLLALFSGSAHAAYPGANGKIAFDGVSTVNPDGSGLTHVSPDGTSGHGFNPTWSPDGSKIAFASNYFFGGGTPYDIYVMNGDGSGIVRVTNFGPSGFRSGTKPSWSPDGQKIAFASQGSGTDSDVFVVDVDGSGEVNLTSGSGLDEQDPAWAPDGSRILFTSDNDRIYSMLPDGSGRTFLSAGDDPDWSPDSSQIAFHSTEQFAGAEGDIYTMHRDGANVTPLASTPAFETDPSWSPDGSKIVYVLCTGPDRFTDCRPNLYTRNADGSGPTPVVATAGENGDPDWGVATAPQPPPADLPGKIAFASLRNFIGASSGSYPQYEIYSMSPNGTRQTRLTNNAAEDSQPAWSPDGTRLAFQSNRVTLDQNGFDIYSMNADGTSQTRLTTSADYEADPTWSPDGNRIAYYRVPASSGTTAIYVMNSDGTGQTLLSSPGGFSLTWSPDGTKIAFIDYRLGENDLFTINADGTGEQNLTFTGPSEFDPAWSPDGTKIAFTRQPGNGQPTEVWTMYPDGTGQTQITNETALGGSAGSPTWSSDGSRIAYDSDAHGPDNRRAEIYSINVDGTGRTDLTNAPAADVQPSEQPILNTAGYPRPKGATPIYVPLVPAFATCTAPNRVHAPPLSFGACTPTVQASSYLTIGTPDANGAQANSSGSERIKVVPGNLATPANEANLKFDISLTDVRKTSDLSDYTGQLRFEHSIRITDRSSNGPAPATTKDLPFVFGVPCVREAPSGVGATCSLSTTANSVLPGAVTEGRRSVWELAQVKVFDGGADANWATAADNKLFAVQGVFAP
jgi:Tol biopolymer transport system component